MSAKETKYSKIIQSTLEEMRALENAADQSEDILAGVELDAERIAQVEELKEAARGVVASGYFDALPFPTLPVEFLPGNSGFLKLKRVYPKLKVLGAVRDVEPVATRTAVAATSSITAVAVSAVKVVESLRVFLLSDTGLVLTGDLKKTHVATKAQHEAFPLTPLDEEYPLREILVEKMLKGKDTITMSPPIEVEHQALTMPNGLFKADELFQAFTEGCQTMLQNKRKGLSL